jgi:hypothetical protein
MFPECSLNVQVKEREKANPKFEFLFPESPHHAYYRARLRQHIQARAAANQITTGGNQTNQTTTGGVQTNQAPPGGIQPVSVDKEGDDDGTKVAKVEVKPATARTPGACVF